jgi:hypothetical protein
VSLGPEMTLGTMEQGVESQVPCPTALLTLASEVSKMVQELLPR